MGFGESTRPNWIAPVLFPRTPFYSPRSDKQPPRHLGRLRDFSGLIDLVGEAHSIPKIASGWVSRYTRRLPHGAKNAFRHHVRG